MQNETRYVVIAKSPTFDFADWFDYSCVSVGEFCDQWGFLDSNVVVNINPAIWEQLNLFPVYSLGESSRHYLMEYYSEDVICEKRELGKELRNSGLNLLYSPCSCRSFVNMTMEEIAKEIVDICQYMAKRDVMIAEGYGVEF